MVALPDTHMPEAPLKVSKAPTAIDDTRETHPLKRAAMAGLGAATLLAALGVWFVPIEAGDTAMQLVKLVFSVSMLVLGMLFISALDSRKPDPEIHLDTHRKLLKVVEYDKAGAAHIAGSYALDDLSDITLRDRHLTARDAKGAQIVSVPVRNAAAEMAIREALREVL